MITTRQELRKRASATGFVLAQGTHQAEEQNSQGHQRENQIKQCSDEEQSLQTKIMHRRHAKRVFLVKKTLTEVESSRTNFEVLGLGLEASSPRKLACPRLEDSTIFLSC